MRRVGVATAFAATVIVAAGCGGSGSSGIEAPAGGQPKLVAEDLTGGLLLPEDMPSTVKAATEPPLTINLQDQASSSLEAEQPLAAKEVEVISPEGGLTDTEAAGCASWATSGWTELSGLEGMTRVYAEKAFPFASSLVGNTVVAGPEPADLDRVREMVRQCSGLQVTLNRWRISGKMVQKLASPPPVAADDVVVIKQFTTWPANMPAEAMEQGKLFTGEVVFMVKGTATVMVYTSGPAGVTASQLAARALERAMKVLT